MLEGQWSKSREPDLTCARRSIPVIPYMSSSAHSHLFLQQHHPGTCRDVLPCPRAQVPLQCLGRRRARGAVCTRLLVPARASAPGQQLVNPLAQQVRSCFLRKDWLFKREEKEPRGKTGRGAGGNKRKWETEGKGSKWLEELEMECRKDCVSPVALSTQQILWCVCFITDRVLPSVGLFPNCWSCKLLDLWLCSSVLALGYNMLFLPGWEVNNELTARLRFNKKLSIQGSLL